MSASLYGSTAAQFVRGLHNLSALLEKGAAWAKESGTSEESVLNTRLAEDMYPLMRQVQIVSDMSKGAVARLAGVTPPAMEDTETTFAELQARIAKTISFIESVKPEQLDGDDSRPITVKGRNAEHNFTAHSYVMSFAIPNFYFHVTTAYNILRHLGVKLGKSDFLGEIK
ncbi:DUF1993 domain-containing protein [Ewingella americana]|jgi:hypothetical protein|uniref:DUF1993 domain-containing protein n=1 Tax=Ewingella americana TaxID=41202 RepID=A0A502G1S1_9GAMM|nr:DUF1993 domain-containing protein [Ewingella americana]TPG55808.1 DUF1993 domain-containing protein [Ewingella americana]